MTIFREGQRVKKIAGERCIGITGTVVAVGTPHAADARFNMQVKCDCEWVSRASKTRQASVVAHVNPDSWAPLSNSNTLVSWESMRDLWVPEHLRVAA
jgi:hypothetical protein